MVTPATVDEVLSRLPEDPQRAAAAWSDALRPAAAREGVLALALHHLARPDDEPARRELAAARVRAAWLRRHLDQALAALAGAGVPTATLKGPDLAARLYPEPGLRPSVDLDLLVARADVDLALTALTSAGWWSGDGPTARYQRRHHHHLHLERADAPLLELHLRAFTGFGVELASEPLLARARAGRLDPVDELLYLVLHAAGHQAERLLWLYDLKLLAPPPERWAAAAAAARALGGGLAFAYVLEALRRRLRVAAPAPRDLGLPDPGATRLRLARRLGEAVSRLAPGPARTSGQLWFGALLCEPPARAAPFLAHHLGRIARRRVQGALPGLAPAEWAA